jgi:hypothetical protein
MDHIKKLFNIHLINSAHPLLKTLCLGFALLGSTSVLAESVKLKVLVIATGDALQDTKLAYIKPVLDEMGVPYDVININNQDITKELLSPSGCDAVTAGCVGNYNGIILTEASLQNIPGENEWKTLHAYERDFKVREAVLFAGWDVVAAGLQPTYPYLGADGKRYLDYGVDPLANACDTQNVCEARWATGGGEALASNGAYRTKVLEYVNRTQPLWVTDYAIRFNSRAGTPTELADGTTPSLVKLLQLPNEAGKPALVGIIRYTAPGQTVPVREVFFTTISNEDWLIHSKVLAYEFINWATQGVFVGGRKVYFSAHLDDLFIPDVLWDSATNSNFPDDTPNGEYRLSAADIDNAVAKQSAFRNATKHPTAGNGFKLDFAFNGVGAVAPESATSTTPVVNMNDPLVAKVVAKKSEFRFINHTFTHADMDKPHPEIGTYPTGCDYPTFPNTTAGRKAIEDEITKNRTVSTQLGLGAVNRVIVTGNHSGLKDRNCTDDVFQLDDVGLTAGGANPTLFAAAANKGVDYLASDSSQKNGQDQEMYVTNNYVNDGSSQDRLLLPRYPTNVFFNVIDPAGLEDEYNYIFTEVLGGTPGGLTQPRNYGEILIAEADSALRHMLSFKKWPHFFHQTNLAKYDASGNTLMFDWLNAAYSAYEKLFSLPVRNEAYHLIGDKTKESLQAKDPAANLVAIWNRTTQSCPGQTTTNPRGQGVVTLQVAKSINNLLVTGLQGGTTYGGQLILEKNVTPSATQCVLVNQSIN